MAASRSVLEALLARVQQRASEPRVSAVVNERSGAAAAVASPAALSAGAAEALDDAEDARTLPPTAAELSDEDIEEYDDELIEIIDDAEVIPQAAAAARAIDVGALAQSLGRRHVSGAAALQPGTAPASKPAAAASRPAPASRPASAPASVRGAAVARSGAAEVLRPEAVAPRPVAGADVAQVRGGRRELRASSFIELLDASLKLGA